jgi:hypothetical protein
VNDPLRGCPIGAAAFILPGEWSGNTSEQYDFHNSQMINSHPFFPDKMAVSLFNGQDSHSGKKDPSPGEFF